MSSGLGIFSKFKIRRVISCTCFFLCPAVTDNALFNLQRRIFKHFHAVLLRREHGYAARLRHVDNRFGVCIIKQLFNRHRLGVKALHQKAEVIINHFEPPVERGSRLRRNRTVIQNGKAVVAVFEHPVADNGIARVYS